MAKKRKCPNRMGSSMKPTEKLAKEILEGVLPEVRVICVDNGGQSGLYDLDLVREGEQTPFAAVEVTSTVVADLKS